MASPFVNRLNELFAELGAHMGIPGITFDDQNMLTLRIDSKLYLFVAFESSDDGCDYRYLSIVRRLVSLPQDKSEQLALLRDIAGKNCFFRNTFGGTLGLHNEALYFINSFSIEELHDRLSLERNIERTINLCNGFIDDFKNICMTEQAGVTNELDEMEEYMNAFGNINLRV